MYSDYLIEEYRDVLTREKFNLPRDVVDQILRLFTENGILYNPSDDYVVLPDPDDMPIFLISQQTREKDSYLVTGNVKHFPDVDYVVTPRQIVNMLSLDHL